MKRKQTRKMDGARCLRGFHVVLLFLMVALLCACSQASSIPTAPVSSTHETTSVETTQTVYPSINPTTIPTSLPETIPTEPVFVYENALEDFLLPIDEYSWERQYAPEFVMIHFTSAVVNHRDQPYNIERIREIFVEYNVSVHYIIERDGTIRCYVPEDRVAWHAGKGEWNNNPVYTNAMNQYAIGIELVAIGSETDMSIYLTQKEYEELDDTLVGFTDEQYESLKQMISDICQRYGIAMDRQHIIGHEEYSSHKTDPGELFDWSRILSS